MNALDTAKARAYSPIVVEAHRIHDKTLNPNDEHMGSITFGNADPTMTIGPALPPDINRDGFGRVRVVVATS